MKAASENSEQGIKNPISGNISFPMKWTVFAPFENNGPLSMKLFESIPEKISIGGKSLCGVEVRPLRNQFDFEQFFGKTHDVSAFRKTAFVFLKIKSDGEENITLGIGGDYWLKAWFNGVPLFGGTEIVNSKNSVPCITDNIENIKTKKGINILAVRLIGGKGKAVLAIGGPADLRNGDFKTIIGDPLLSGQGWNGKKLRAKAGGTDIVDIASRRELFVDSFMVEKMTGGSERRLHHPVPREIVLTHGGIPWEGKFSGYHSIVQDGDIIRIYYNGRLPGAKIEDKSKDQVTCIAESRNGIDFTRPVIGIYDIGGFSNNVVLKGRGGHNLAPFIDQNPQALPDERYKAVAYHTGGKGLGAYVSPDGIKWKLMIEKAIITVENGLDSQNLAFWDAMRKKYICFFRDNLGGLRRISRSVSDDFINWSPAELIKYSDERQENMYINGIRPYFRAPHIYIGLPARFINSRKKIESHKTSGVSDAILISSRDSMHFERWEEAFIRPGGENEIWTDRNNYPAWGMLQTRPEEISIYWNEHFKHEGNRLRRGSIRTDGFVSVHAGKDVGEMLTRPFIFSGDSLEVNYETSAAGTMLFELCDISGRAYRYFSLSDSEILFGNEMAHNVNWLKKSILSKLAGKPVRLRVRMQDADLYSFRFYSSETND